MDQNTLTIVAVTAIVAAVAKEAVAATFKMTGHAWKAFRTCRPSTSNLIQAVPCFLVWISSVIVLGAFFYDQSPATKSHISLASLTTINLLTYGRMMMGRMERYRENKLRETIRAEAEAAIAPAE